MELFDMMRTAVNGTESAAREWSDRQEAIVRGEPAEESAPEIVIVSEEDASRYLRSIGR